MTKPFMHADFLLDTAAAAKLYHTYAEALPIIDYHCHIPALDIAEDRRFENLTRAWLAGDHYKWRAMRTCGVDESLITGTASDREKFAAWAETVPKTIRNPLYHWTHLELARNLGIDNILLGPDTAEEAWKRGNARLAARDMGALGILQRMRVEVVCTTDDPVDTLADHRRYAKARKRGAPRLVPAWRPDKILATEDPAAFIAYLGRLEEAAGREVETFEDLIQALEVRHAFFHENGCRLSDHGLETVYAENYGVGEVEEIFAWLRKGLAPSPEEAAKFKSAVLFELAVMDHEKGWVQQLHLGALRNVNSRMFRRLGPDSGCDAIADGRIARPLARFLDQLDAAGRLPKTIIYNLNPRDNELVAALAGAFQEGPAPGKVQFGAAWWFLDQLDGMTRQIEALSNLGILAQFVGMLTDSRSLLSYPRHEYFRRLLCRILGREMEQGLLPMDLELVGRVVADICYHNAKRYFPFAAEGAGHE